MCVCVCVGGGGEEGSGSNIESIPHKKAVANFLVMRYKVPITAINKLYDMTTIVG